MSKEAYKSGRVKQAAHNRNREFIICLAYVSAIGKRVPATLLYTSESFNLRNTWVQNLEEQDDFYFSILLKQLATLGYPFLPLQLQPLVSSFYYWNMLTYRRTNRSISISIRLRSLNLYLGISVVIVSLPRYGVNHMVRWESGI